MKNIQNFKSFVEVLNEKSFWDTKNDDYLTSRHKEDDLEIRKLKPKTGDWVNLRSEFGDVWHKVIKTYEPDDFYGDIQYYKPVDSKSEETKTDFAFYYKIRKISHELPPRDAKCIFDENGAYSERRGNLKKWWDKN